MKKTKVVFVTLSAQLDDGSRKTLSTSEICSCKDRGMAELIMALLRDNSAYRTVCDNDTAAPNECMYFLSTVN